MTFSDLKAIANISLLFRGKLVWKMVSKVFDVPYGDHFEHHETWKVLSTSDTAVRCIL